MRFPWQRENKTELRSAPAIPEKVYVGKEGKYWEYSPDAPYERQNLLDLLDGAYGEQNLLELFYCLPEVFAPINEIASRVADATWQLRKDWNDEVDYKNATFNKLFTKPNPLVSNYRDMIYMAVVYEICTGKQFFYKNQPSTLPDEFSSVLSWTNLPAHRVEVDPKKGVDTYSATELNDLINYYWVPQYGRKRIFETAKVLAIVKNTLHCNDDGYPDLKKIKAPLRGADKAIMNLIPVYQARHKIYVKRGMLGLLVSKKSDETGNIALTAGEKKELRRDMNGDYGLTGDKDTVAITNQPVEYQRVAMTINELQPFEETEADASAIYTVLRVPKHLMPRKGNSTFNNAAADMKSFYSDVIIPWAKRYADAFTEFFGLTKERRYICADFSHIDVLQENRLEKSKIDQTYGAVWLLRWQSGVCSLNDWITAIDGDKGSGPVYEKKLFELTPEELEQAKAVINMKTTQNASSTATSEDTGEKAPGAADQL